MSSKHWESHVGGYVFASEDSLNGQRDWGREDKGAAWKQNGLTVVVILKRRHSTNILIR